MSDLRELYQELILDHGRKPRNYRALPDARSADGYNPLCGDEVHVFVKLDGNVVEDVSFQGQGCAISTASASLMTQMLKGKTVTEATELFQTFHDLVTGRKDDEESRNKVGKLVVLLGVRAFPVRVKCATLPWHTLQAALNEKKTPVTTE
ncbi:MAG: SUF system NifU family Fe-S cluster assembly protein [Planctomycetota bacterium]|nr:SUF system NifU family Fe-S cluster assembly protein [Planctomycetota bacterium]